MIVPIFHIITQFLVIESTLSLVIGENVDILPIISRLKNLLIKESTDRHPVDFYMARGHLNSILKYDSINSTHQNALRDLIDYLEIIKPEKDWSPIFVEVDFDYHDKNFQIQPRHTRNVTLGIENYPRNYQEWFLIQNLTYTSGRKFGYYLDFIRFFRKAQIQYRGSQILTLFYFNNMKEKEIVNTALIGRYNTSLEAISNFHCHETMKDFQNPDENEMYSLIEIGAACGGMGFVEVCTDNFLDLLKRREEVSFNIASMFMTCIHRLVWENQIRFDNQFNWWLDFENFFSSVLSPTSKYH